MTTKKKPTVAAVARVVKPGITENQLKTVRAKLRRARTKKPQS
jgi:hypothetical protein